MTSPPVPRPARLQPPTSRPSDATAVVSHRLSRRAPSSRAAATSSLLLAATLAALPVSAQEPPELVTDRPDQTESAVTVPPGFVQLEAGVDHAEAGGDADAESTAVGSSLLRVGLAERVELRLGWGGWAREEAGGESVDGVSDGEVGLKVGLWEERGARPQAAFLAGVSVPAGERGFSTERWDPAMRLSFAHDLGRGVGLGYNLGMAWSSEELPGGGPGAERREAVSRLEYTVALGFGLSERMGAFVELFGDAPVDAPPGSDGPAHAADAGVTWLLTPSLQLDVAAGAGLSDAAPDFLATAGVSIRWPR